MIFFLHGDRGEPSLVDKARLSHQSSLACMYHELLKENQGGQHFVSQTDSLIFVLGVYTGGWLNFSIIDIFLVLQTKSVPLANSLEKRDTFPKNTAIFILY